MIRPDVDVDKASDDEILAAYAELGITGTLATVYLDMLRSPSSEFLTD